jgi:threonylcarbamoyladenosine tRNA methylthiotransferase MtaB
LLKAAFPNAALTTDVIVGFPGETGDEFTETVDFCRTVGFMKIHVFPYSPREGTPAAEMPGQICKRVKDERAKRLAEVGERLSAAYRRKLLGSVQPVLIEERGRGGMWSGYTPQYVPVASPFARVGEILPVRLTALTEEGMLGEAVEPNNEGG